MTWHTSSRQEFESMPKEAVFGALLSGLGHVAGHAAAAGAAGHVGANLLGTAAHHTNIGEMMAHRGFQDALTGSKMNRASMLAQKYLMEPESLAGYNLAHAAGSKIRDLHSSEQAAAIAHALGKKPLNAKQNAIVAGGSLLQHLSPELKDSPLVGDLSKAMHHHLAGTAPELANKGHSSLLGSTLGKAQGHIQSFLANRTDTQFDSTARRLMNSAPGAAAFGAAAAGDIAATGMPVGLMAHMTINGGRAAIGQSNFGKKVMGNMFSKGLRGGEISKAREMATNLLVSPGVLDPYRVGKAVHDTAQNMGPDLGAHVQALGQVPVGEAWNKLKNTAAIPGQVANTAQQAHAVFNAAKAKPGLTPLQSLGTVAAGGAGLAGAGYLAAKSLEPEQQKLSHEQPEEPLGLFESSPQVRRAMAYGRGVRAGMGGDPVRAGRILSRAALPPHQQRALATLLASTLSQKQAAELAQCVGI